MLNLLNYVAHFAVAFVTAYLLTTYLMTHLPFIPAYLLSVFVAYHLTIMMLQSLDFVLNFIIARKGGR